MISLWRDRARELSCGVFRGFRALDGRFEEDRQGRYWLGFQEPEDVVLWCPTTNQIALAEGRCFAVNEEVIGNAGTYALDASLRIHASMADWILCYGAGIFVVDWRHAFDKLRHAPRIEIDGSLRATYERAMRPRLPAVTILQSRRRAAA